MQLPLDFGKTRNLMTLTFLLTTICSTLKQVLATLWTIQEAVLTILAAALSTTKVPSVIPPRPFRLPQRPLRRLLLLLWRTESLCYPSRTSRQLAWQATQTTLLGPSVHLALSNLLCFADFGSMEQDALCAPMTMGVKGPGAFWEMGLVIYFLFFPY